MAGLIWKGTSCKTIKDSIAFEGVSVVSRGECAQIISEACNACGVCTQGCPFDAIVKKG